MSAGTTRGLATRIAWTALLASVLAAGCSEKWETLPGTYRGSVDYSSQGSTILSRTPNADGSFDAQVRHFSRSETRTGTFEVRHLGEAYGNQRFEVVLGDHCTFRFESVSDGSLQASLEDNTGCACVFDSEVVEATPIAIGSYDEHHLDLDVELTVGGPEHSGGCSYHLMAQPI